MHFIYFLNSRYLLLCTSVFKSEQIRFGNTYFVRMCNLLVYFLSVARSLAHSVSGSICVSVDVIIAKLLKSTKPNPHLLFFSSFFSLCLQIQFNSGFKPIDRRTKKLVLFCGTLLVDFFFGVRCNCQPVGYCVYLSHTTRDPCHGHTTHLYTNRK